MAFSDRHKQLVYVFLLQACQKTRSIQKEKSLSYILQLEFLFQIINSTIADGVAIIEEQRVDLKINT